MGFVNSALNSFPYRITCFADQPAPNCCSRLNVQASGRIQKTQGARLGEYKRIDEFNKHPVYHLSQFNYQSYLYFRMEGILQTSINHALPHNQYDFIH